MDRLTKEESRALLVKMLVIHGFALLFCVAFLLVSKQISALLPHSGCVMVRVFGLYCPGCGGTRAVSELLRFRFAKALSYNSFVVLVVFLLLVGDIFLWIGAIRGKKPLLRVPGWLWIALVTVMLLYGVLRNLLMIFGGYDPVGDLGLFWQTLRK